MRTKFATVVVAAALLPAFSPTTSFGAAPLPGKPHPCQADLTPRTLTWQVQCFEPRTVRITATFSYNTIGGVGTQQARSSFSRTVSPAKPWQDQVVLTPEMQAEERCLQASTAEGVLRTTCYPAA